MIDMPIFEETFKKTTSFLYQSLQDGAISIKQSVGDFKAKHIPSYVLSIGAMINVGLLSFFGAVALMGGALGGPVLFVACMALFLSVAYEGEIYVQNIKGSFKKLFKASYLERELAKKCLIDDFKLTSGNECPAFFRKYDELNKQLKAFSNKNLDKASRKDKKRLEKQLSDMEKWFAIQLFSQDSAETVYQQKMRKWVTETHAGQQVSLRDKWAAVKQSHQVKLTPAKIFCSLDAVLMGVGISYLLVGLFMAVPFFTVLPVAIWPMLIIPLAVFSGVAHGHLMHNAVTDTIVKDIATRWLIKIKAYFAEGKTTRAVVTVFGLSAFFVLTVMLSICTFGTWVTIARVTPALFASMRRMPSFIMSVLNPLVSSIAVFLFNIENISETVEQLDEASKGVDSVSVWLKRFFMTQLSAIKISLVKLRQEENWLQIINPFRLIASVYTPLRYLLFTGHIASISLMGDQMKHVPIGASMAVGAVNELGEDLHYFVDFDDSSADEDTLALRRARLEGEDDSHDTDIPTRVLSLIFWPLHRLAASWDCLFSQLNRHEGLRLGYRVALDKQLGKEQEESVKLKFDENEELIADEGTWQKEQIIYLLDKHAHKHLQGAWVGQKIQTDKKEQLVNLKSQILEKTNSKEMIEIIQKGSKNPVYSQGRFFDHGHTATCKFLENLPSRVSAPAA